jgi:hypothetical protein
VTTWGNEAVTITKGELATVLVALDELTALAGSVEAFAMRIIAENAADIVSRRLLGDLPPE